MSQFLPLQIEDDDEGNLHEDNDGYIFIFEESNSGIEKTVVFKVQSHFVSKLLIYTVKCSAAKFEKSSHF